MATCGGGGSWAAGIVRLLQSLGRRSALAVVALRDVRRCLSSTTLRDYCAGRHITTWRRQHDVHGRRRRPGRATNLQDSDEAATAGRRGIDVKFLCTQVLPSRYTPCIVWNTVYHKRSLHLAGVCYRVPPSAARSRVAYMYTQLVHRSLAAIAAWGLLERNPKRFIIN